MGNTLFDKISPCRTIFIFKIVWKFAIIYESDILGVKVFYVLTRLRSLKSDTLLQIRANGTEKCQLHTMGPNESHHPQNKGNLTIWGRKCVSYVVKECVKVTLKKRYVWFQKLTWEACNVSFIPLYHLDNTIFKC
jgi:hypothetical protein